MMLKLATTFQVAAGLQAKGLGHGECVSIFSENSHRWLITDQVWGLSGT